MSDFRLFLSNLQHPLPSGSIMSNMPNPDHNQNVYNVDDFDVPDMRLPSYRASQSSSWRYHPYPRTATRRHWDPFWDDFEAPFDFPASYQEPSPPPIDFFAHRNTAIQVMEERAVETDAGDIVVDKARTRCRYYILIVLEHLVAAANRIVRNSAKI
ncbi:hypothetical protein HGRIS_007931 [Hohenbuehelia grisea]|uniref:Uncharacterized protein n=1 Tax=Hohenbuehelia grisea TaxID=104357 RepID=A0ABR3J7R9_9AGAR